MYILEREDCLTRTMRGDPETARKGLEKPKVEMVPSVQTNLKHRQVPHWLPAKQTVHHEQLGQGLCQFRDFLLKRKEEIFEEAGERERTSRTRKFVSQH